MKSFKSRQILPQLAAACLLALPAGYAADARKAPTPLRASVGEVTDNRTTGSFSSECKIELKFTGDAASDSGSVRQVRLTEALDELGRDLRPAKDEHDSSSSFGSRSSGSLRAEVKLRNPSRNATVIKSLKGEVELFSPTEANGAILTIKDALKHPAEPIAHPSLSKYGVVLMYLTKEAYESKKKELEAQSKAASSDAGDKIAQGFGELFKGMFGGMMSGSKDALQFYVKDPQKRVVSLEFQDAAGKPLKTRSKWSSNEFQQTELAGPPPADTQLVVNLAVPEAVKTVPFEIHDIPLP